jgi:hypothetical protein
MAAEPRRDERTRIVDFMMRVKMFKLRVVEGKSSNARKLSEKREIRWDRLAMDGCAIVCLYPAEGNENGKSEEGGCPRE